MAVQSLLLFLLIGLIAGWLAGQIWKKSGFGFVGNLVIGIFGALIGGILFHLVGITFHGFIGSLIAAVVGALILLYLINMFKK
jgi:uncharacterized membrane protein YeaQ/YmgE (transglycosylase-associated protein family)